MKVLIVAKTRYGNDCCIGALTYKGKSLRLKELDESFPPQNMYSVGDIWEVKTQKSNQLTPPHIETVLVTTRDKIGS
ncbi:MAG: hypothetical protein JW841_16515 [Deltaproteobacteria bacterium]|nr:hypothetical protein [Deltaproteobacteria bacterium]